MRKMVFILLAMSLALADTRIPPTGAGATEVEKIFVDRCTSCHGGDDARADLRLEPRWWIGEIVEVASLEKPELKLVDVRQPDRSYLLMKIQGAPGIRKKPMPPRGDPLSADEIQTIAAWAASLAQPQR